MDLSSLYGELAEAGSGLPPQGLCTLAACLRQKGYDPLIIDATAERLNLRQTLAKIKKNLPALFVGFGLYYVSEETVAKLALSLKKNNLLLTIVVGGGHVSVMASQLMKKYPQFDVAVIGEAEESIVEVTRALEKRKKLGSIKGIVFRQKRKIVKTSYRPFIKNLDRFPFPAWDLLPPLKEYYFPAADSLKRWPSTVLITSRGCPGNCFFCNKNAFGSLLRQNSPEYVMAEIKELQNKFGVKDIYFQDDTFTANRDWVVKFCRLLTAKKLDLTWSCHGRTDLVDLRMLKLMKKAGCWQISFGIESGSQKVLDAINKQTTVKQNKKALDLCRKAGLAVKGLFMIGSFGETRQTIKQTKKFIRKNYMTDCHITFYTLVPGTVAARIWPKYGKNPKGKVPSVTARPSFIPFGLTKKELIKAHKELYRTFYFRPRIIGYFLGKLRYPYQRKKIIRSASALFRYSILSLFSKH